MTRDIADDPIAMALVRHLYRLGYAPDQVSAGVCLVSMEPPETELLVTHSPWVEGVTGHNYRRTSEGVIECDFDTGPSEIGDVPIADVQVVAELLDEIRRGAPIRG